MLIILSYVRRNTNTCIAYLCKHYSQLYITTHDKCGIHHWSIHTRQSNRLLNKYKAYNYYEAANTHYFYQ